MLRPTKFDFENVSAGKEENIFICGVPRIDPAALQKTWKEFDERALPAMLQWVKTAGETVQYADVMEKLQSMGLPYAHENAFLKESLLPTLKNSDELTNVPIRLLIILYTLTISASSKILLDFSVKSPMHILFSIQLIIQGKKFISDYALSNYLDPNQAKISLAGTKSAS